MCDQEFSALAYFINYCMVQKFMRHLWERRTALTVRCLSKAIIDHTSLWWFNAQHKFLFVGQEDIWTRQTQYAIRRLARFHLCQTMITLSLIQYSSGIFFHVDKRMKMKMAFDVVPYLAQIFSSQPGGNRNISSSLHRKLSDIDVRHFLMYHLKYYMVHDGCCFSMLVIFSYLLQNFPCQVPPPA